MTRFLDEEVLTFAGIFDALEDLVILLKADGNTFRFSYVNPAAASILPLPKDIVGYHMNEMDDYKRLCIWVDKLKQVLLEKKSVKYTESLYINGEEFIGEASLSPVNKNGDDFILVIIRDITADKLKEKELTETKSKLDQERKRLHSLVENNGEAVFELDLNGNMVSANMVLSTITGYSEQELLGKSFIGLIDKKYLKKTIFYFRDTIAGNKAEYETCIYDKDRKVRHLAVRNIPITVDEVIVGVFVIAKDITIQKKLEQQLEESEQRYKSIFENHPDAIYSFDLNGHFTSGNAGAERISGYSMNQLKGKNIEGLIAPEKLEQAKYYIKKSIENKQTESYYTTLLHKEGHRVELSVMSIPIMVNDQIVGVYGIAKDITEEKRREKALIEAKEELEIFWNHSVDPIFFISTKGDILKVNPAFERTFGYKEREVVMDQCSIVPDDMKEDPLAIDARIRNGETVSYHETKRITKSGELLDIISSYTPVRDENGRIIGATVFYKNVTELKKAERELLKSQEKYRLITDTAFDVIKMIDLSGKIEYTSPSNEKILGYPASEYKGKDYTSFIHQEDIPLIEKGMEHIISGGHPAPIEFRVRHRNGYYIWMEATATPVIEDGKMRQIVTIERDVTERKRLRDELEKAAFYDYLSGLPNRRTFDERLDVAIKRADCSGKKVAVMILDGHNFKQINDTFGHDAGDAVIEEMAKRIQECVRKTDTVARLGGDEMAIILPELETVQESLDIADRVIASFDAPLYFNDFVITIGAGMGIAIYPDQSKDKKQLLKLADIALYQAKEQKQNNYKVYR